jgi:hypothetical protein
MTDRLPRSLLHLEGVLVAVAAVALYFHLGYPWWLLLLLALAPDLSMLGYVAGPRVGAIAYTPRTRMPSPSRSAPSGSSPAATSPCSLR